MKTLLGLGFLIVTVAIFTGFGSSDVHAQQVRTEVATNYSTLYVTNIVVLTNTIVVTNEVVKEVPAQIPDEYLNAKTLVDRIMHATTVSHDKALFQMKDVKCICLLDESIKSIVSEDALKARFELTLRKNGITINDQSKNKLILNVDALVMDGGNTIVYELGCRVPENQLILRNHELHYLSVYVWDTPDEFGRVGKLKVEESILNTAEKDAEIFANDFLSANPKNNEAQK